MTLNKSRRRKDRLVSHQHFYEAPFRLSASYERSYEWHLLLYLNSRELSDWTEGGLTSEESVSHSNNEDVV